MAWTFRSDATNTIRLIEDHRNLAIFGLTFKEMAAYTCTKVQFNVNNASIIPS